MSSEVEDWRFRRPENNEDEKKSNGPKNINKTDELDDECKSIWP